MWLFWSRKKIAQQERTSQVEAKLQAAAEKVKQSARRSEEASKKLDAALRGLVSSRSKENG